MTIREALAQRLPRIRKPEWVDHSYMRLPLLAGGGHGPWAELYDDHVQQTVLNLRPGSQRVLLLVASTCSAITAPTLLDEPGFEVYAGPISAFEQHEENFAKLYADA